jgi:hypothetical protein
MKHIEGTIDQVHDLHVMILEDKVSEANRQLVRAFDQNDQHQQVHRGARSDHVAQTAHR